MSSRLFEAFEARVQQVKEYMAGCGQKYGMACTCGPGCRCANCSEHCKQNRRDSNERMGQQSMNQNQLQNMQGYDQFNGGMMGNGGPPPQISTTNMNDYGDSFGSGMQGYGGSNGMNMNNMDNGGRGQLSPLGNDDAGGMNQRIEMPMRGEGRRASRNPSVISFGGIGGIRGMSVTSEATFGRAMSGLSALSIDWENLEDFDVNVDHSAHINNNGAGGGMKKEVDSSSDRK
jgi:hypothetical protein